MFFSRLYDQNDQDHFFSRLCEQNDQGFSFFDSSHHGTLPMSLHHYACRTTRSIGNVCEKPGEGRIQSELLSCVLR